MNGINTHYCSFILRREYTDKTCRYQGHSPASSLQLLLFLTTVENYKCLFKKGSFEAAFIFNGANNMIKVNKKKSAAKQRQNY